ncbi:MAG: hypothetical protein GY862_38495 [Gammaproteobacteria bacterium]|nr:hypothetical protein [Gammaproteobacteria bacterium]
MSSCKIIFPPDLDINPQEFAQLWNADTDAQALAGADVESGGAQQYASPETMMIVLGFLGGLAGAAATAAVQEITKRLIAKWWKEKKPAESAPALELLEKTLEDGTKMLVVLPKKQ